MKADKFKLLYVDDEEANLRVFKNAFGREFEVFTASSGKQGLMILDQEDVDLVITDQKMPEMTGMEFLREVKKKIPFIPPNRLVISAYAEQDIIDEAYDTYDVFRFVSKPWKRDELKAVIDDAIKEKSDLDEDYKI